jgi:hypothetical protein
MKADEIIKKAQDDFARLSKIPVSGVTGLNKTDDGWVVFLEAVERKAIPDTMDVLGLYEIRLDSDGNLIRFERKKLRKRGDTKEE